MFTTLIYKNNDDGIYLFFLKNICGAVRKKSFSTFIFSILEIVVIQAKLFEIARQIKGSTS